MDTTVLVDLLQREIIAMKLAVMDKITVISTAMTEIVVAEMVAVQIVL